MGKYVDHPWNAYGDVVGDVEQGVSEEDVAEATRLLERYAEQLREADDMRDDLNILEAEAEGTSYEFDDLVEEKIQPYDPELARELRAKMRVW